MKSLDDSVELCTDNYEDLGSNEDLGSILPLSVCPWREDSTIAHSGWATVKLGIDLGEVFSKAPELAKLFLQGTRTGILCSHFR